MLGTVEKIEAIALAFLEREGAAAVSMRRIAETAGITPMAIYHHFPNRESLLRKITDREFEALADHMDARAGGLLHVMDYYLDYAFTRPLLFDYVFSRFRTDARRFPRDFKARRSPTMNRVADAVSAAMESGEIAHDDVWEVAMEFWALIHGYIALYRAGRFALEEKAFRQLCRRALKRFHNGLKV
jgi:AcrR family transcriptional regulator